MRGLTTGRATATRQGEAGAAEGTAAPLTSTSSLRLRFETPEHVVRFATALTSLFHGSARAVDVRFSTGTLCSDLTAVELMHRLQKGLVGSIGFGLVAHGHEVLVQLERPATRPTEVELRLPVSDAPPSDRFWLQRVPEVPSPLPMLALPVVAGAFAPAAMHGLVGLAAQCGGFIGASMEGSSLREWVRDEPSGGARPVRAILHDALWGCDHVADGEPAAWLIGESSAIRRDSPDASWWARLDELVEAPLAPIPELREHLAQAFAIPFDWAVEDIETAREVSYRVPLEVDVVARLAPCPDRVVLGVDLEQPPRAVADSLLHLCAHCELGHVRPGDPWGHFDTHATATADAVHRRWDRDVAAFLTSVCSRPAARCVASLEECTPVEKAWLVLLDHIGRMVGEARTLHPTAERYQAAAYQRQAAQRLVAQLEDYGGAMLCDGVGLGKTYVATTVLVHYANAWRERLSQDGGSLADDPFRVTILSPNSVVSTWQREAIPPLGAHGVVPAHVRVVSHTKLSRILPSSQILERSHARASDMEHLLLSDLVVVETHESYTRGGRNVEALQGLGIVVGLIVGAGLQRGLWVKTVLPSEWNPRKWSHSLVSAMMVKKHSLSGNYDAHAALMIAEYADSQIKIWQAQRKGGNGRLQGTSRPPRGGGGRLRRERMPDANVSRKVQELLKHGR